MKKKLIVGNWKMNPETREEAGSLFGQIADGAGKAKNAAAVICPPFLYISELVALAGKKKTVIGAEDVFHEEQGSYTGAVSAKMLKKAGVRYVIVGHSERRQLGETDEIVNKKAKIALKAGMIPIICVGEAVRDEEGRYLAAVKSQIEKALSGIMKRDLASVVIAYEPVFAIGADEAMGAREVHEMMIFIKKTIVDLFKLKAPVSFSILYGGAVNSENAHGILAESGTDGLLVGRQSLVPDNFIEILKLADK